MKVIKLSAACVLALLSTNAMSEADGPVAIVELPLASQAPTWPPGEITDVNGDMITIGLILREDEDGNVFAEPGASLVSKNTVPPLDENGVEDFSNIMGAPYDVIRELDLSEGSPDLDMPIFTNSYGPVSGDFGGGPRSPKVGDSAYNLNGLPVTCPEVFPTASQEFVYTRDRFPLSNAAVLGFQGDQIAYDVETGIAFDPFLSSGEGCGAGCSGENEVDNFQFQQFTLGDWAKGSGRARIQLKDFDEATGHYTAADFTIRLKSALPKAVYTVWLARQNVVGNQGLPEFRAPAPAALPNIILTDENGDGELNFDLVHPFPAPEVDEKGLRLAGIAVDFHSDYQTWGACFSRFQAGVDIHAHFVSFSRGNFDMTDFVTTAPSTEE